MIHPAISLNPGVAVYCDSFGNVFGRHAKWAKPPPSMSGRWCSNRIFQEALYNLGSALTEEGKFVDAISCFEQALGFKPHFSEALSTSAPYSLGPVGRLTLSPDTNQHCRLNPVTQKLFPTSVPYLSNEVNGKMP
jgi:hypothetical protein